MRKSLRKALGWSKDVAQQVEFLAKTTRDSQKHLMIGMRQVTRTGEYVIAVYDRVGTASKIAAVSKDLEDRDVQLELYRDLSLELELPPHCEECRYAATGHAEFFDGSDDEDASTWLDEDDEDEGWDTDEDVGWV